MPWDKVYIFISSTFNDMHAERDYLVKRVFPRLRDWCERRRLRMMDIDLRWGVTENDATRHAAVVDVCLRRIDACRPFFVCLLGQRYGWIPGLPDVSPGTLAAFPGLDAALAEGLSVTELEVLHAAVRPFAQGGAAPIDPSTGRALFYLRAPASLAGLPEEPPYLRRTFDDAAETDEARRRFLLARQEKLRKVTVPETGRPVATYECAWDPGSFSPELALPLKCPALLPQNVERWRSLWREAAGVEVAGLDVEEDAAQGAKARAFNERITAGRLGGFRVDGEALEERLLRDLREAIERRYPDHSERSAGTDLERELDAQEQFLFVNSEGFVDRDGDFDALDSYLEGGPDRPFVLTGNAGYGKTMLLANWIDRVRTRNPEVGRSVRFRFVGASDGATSVPSLLRSLAVEMKNGGAIVSDVPTDPQELRRAWPGLLAEAGQAGGVVVVVDGLDQLESGLRDLTWVPLALPPGVRLVVSFKPEAPLGVDSLEILRAGGAGLAAVPPFDRPEDRRRLVRAYLSQFLKELDEEHIEALIGVEGASSPLFLKIVLSELRVFGAFSNLGEKIARDFGRTPVEAFDSVMRRLEGDPAYAPLEPGYAVPRLFGLLAHARRGLAVDELGRLLRREPSLDAPADGIEAAAADSASTYLRQVRPFLARREGRDDFFYDAFRQAARRRYTDEEGPGAPGRRLAKDWHRTLADYFEKLPLWLPADSGPGPAGPAPAQPHRRKVSELPYHLALCGDVKGLERTLANLDFVDAKCRAGLIYDLEADYARVLPDGGGGGPALVVPVRWQGRTGAACPYCRGVFERSGPAPGGDGSCPLCGSRLRFAAFAVERPWEARQAVRSVVRPEELGLALPPAIGQFATFVRAKAHLLVDGPALVWQEAANAAAETAPKKAASAARLTGRMKGTWLRRVNRPWLGDPLMTLSGHEGSVVDVAVSSDGRRILSLGIDGSLRVWDVATGAPIMVKPEAVAPRESGKLQLLPHGDLALVVSGQKPFETRPIRLWNYETGQIVREFDARGAKPSSLAVSADGRRFAAACWQSDERGKKSWVAVLVWDLERPNQSAATIPLGKDFKFPGSQAFTPDGRRLIVAAETRLAILDLETGKIERTMEWTESGMLQGAMTVAVSPDGRLALTGGWDATGRVWDLATGRTMATMPGHKGPIQHAAFSPDGAEVVDVSLDTTGKVWDVATGDSLTTFRGQDPMFCVALAPDGRLAVSGDQKGRIQVWDMNFDREHFREIRRSMLERMRALPEPDRSDRRSFEVLVDFVHGSQRHFGPAAAAMTGDGVHLATAGWVDHLVRTWDLKSGKLEHAFGQGRDQMSFVTISPEGGRVLTASDDMTLRLWDVAGEKVLAERSGAAASEAPRNKGGPDLMTWMKEMTTGPRFLTLEFTPDGRQALSVDTERPGIRVWDGYSLADAGEIPVPGAGPGLKFLRSGAILVVPALNGLVHIIDVQARKVLRTIRGFSSGILRPGQQGALDVAFDGRRAACGWQDHTVRVWDVETGDETAILGGLARRDPVVSVAISPDGEFVAASFGNWASSSAGETGIGVWSLASGRPVFERRFASTRVVLAWTNGPRYLVTGGPDEMLRVWDPDRCEPVTTFAARPTVLLARGTTIAAVEEGGEVVVLDLVGSRLKPA